MKTYIGLLFILIGMAGMAQTPPLQNHTWYLEKLIINGNTTYTPQSYIVTSEFWDSMHFDYDGCSYFYGNISYNGNQNFSITSGSVGDDICNNPLDPYDLLYIDDFIQWDTYVNPYSYAFTNQANNLIILTLTNANGDQAIYQNQPLGVLDKHLSQTMVYPNPVKDFLTLQTSGFQLERVEVYDVQGKKLKSYSKNLGQIDMQNFAPGIYILKIYSDQGTSVKKIVKR